MLSKYRHPNIVLMLGAVTVPPNLCIVMELMKEGTLYDLIHRKKTVLSVDDRRRIIKQILSVFVYLHKHGIVHRDIKSHNILLDKSLNVKLCDFGLAKHKVFFIYLCLSLNWIWDLCNSVALQHIWLINSFSRNLIQKR